ncbi:MAG: hypothetical protein KME46_02395 [Brasilonema angustatum HA4187-MV1]|nr:hypothetical protein [Brasilonema angustatum HA4187-MV1]
MRHNADDTANKHSSSGANKLKEKTSRNQVFTAPLPDPITKNIEAISLLHTQEVRDIPTYRRTGAI